MNTTSIRNRITAAATVAVGAGAIAIGALAFSAPASAATTIQQSCEQNPGAYAVGAGSAHRTPPARQAAHRHSADLHNTTLSLGGRHSYRCQRSLDSDSPINATWVVAPKRSS